MNVQNNHLNMLNYNRENGNKINPNINKNLNYMNQRGFNQIGNTFLSYNENENN